MNVCVIAPKRWAQVACEVLDQTLAAKPDAVVSFPTGHTPLPFYAELRRRALVNPGRFSRLRAVMLDDYLDAGELASNFYRWLRRELFDGIGLGDNRLLRIPSESTVPGGIGAACASFERQLEDWGNCDLQFLGLGRNGHIGFNEPGAAVDSRTRTVELAGDTAAANAEYWPGGFVPSSAVTMGIATILSARRICLLVRGSLKRAMLERALCGPVGPEVPASYLQSATDFTVLADTAAGAQVVQMA